MVERTAKLSIQEQMKKIPLTNFLHADRYDDNLHHILHLWDDNGNSFDIVVLKDKISEIDEILKIKTTYVNICGRVALSIGEIKEQYPEYPYNCEHEYGEYKSYANCTGRFCKKCGSFTSS